jgi:uncharacterized damage-inducible protein DinB
MTVHPKGEPMSTRALSTQIYYNLGALKMNLEGLTDGESLVQPQPAGNCLNWVVGHILANRAGILGLLGQDSAWNEEEAEPYKRGSEPLTDRARAKGLDELVAMLETSQESILAGLSEISEEALQAPSPSGKDGETVETALAGLVFHEAYHVGETGILRRLLGHEGAIQ